MQSGINILTVQMQVSMGLPLDRIAEMRRFCHLGPHGNYVLPEDGKVRLDGTGE
jgi:hypothetical protein